MIKALDLGDSAEMVHAWKVLKGWNVKMQREGKPHMRILVKDVQKRVTQRRRKARTTPSRRARRSRACGGAEKACLWCKKQ